MLVGLGLIENYLIITVFMLWLQGVLAKRLMIQSNKNKMS